jgi:hypothetical protein
MGRGRRRPQASLRDAQGDRPAFSLRAALVALLLALVAGVVSYLAFGHGSAPDGAVTAGSTAAHAPWADPQGATPVVGSLDVNPADGSLWLATNTGLFRLPDGAERPQRVVGRLTTELGSGEISQQLVIRFRGPDEMVGSGHPPAGSALPSALGLIESEDAGRRWTGVSDVGYADFHTLRLVGDTVVAAIYGQAAINVSHDGGKTFENRTPPLAVVDLELDPDDPARWIASTSHGLIASSDEGRSWRPREATPNVRFAWPDGDTLYRIDPGGLVKVSVDGGQRWENRGSTGDEPQALLAETADHLDVALIDGTIKQSRDGGRTWTDRLAPAAVK